MAAGERADVVRLNFSPTVRTGSKRRCLWISGMMQSEEFCMLDELTRHNSEADKTETSTLTHVEKPQMSPNALLFLNCTERLNSIWNQILGPWAWKTYCAPPIVLRLSPFRLFYATTVWITLSPSFSLTGLFLVINSQSVGKPHCTI